MKKLVLGALMVALFAACGGGGDDDGGDIMLEPDASGSTTCDPLANTGCADGEKCTWVNVTDTLGRLGCVAEGTAAAGATCAWGPDGDSTGFDNCVHGNICIGDSPGGEATGICEPICSLGTGACAANQKCAQYNIFANGQDTPLFGACDNICDPGTQRTVGTDLPNCGSTATAPRGCYGLFFPVQGGDGEFTCSPSGAAANVHGTEPADIYLNVCAPGYVLYFEDSANYSSQTGAIKCIATCEPGDVNSGATANLDGKVGGAATCHGDPPGGKGVIEAGFECKYMTWHMNTVPARDFSKNGICMKPADWAYADLYQTPPTASCNGTVIPSCTTIAPGTMMDWDCEGPMTELISAEEQWGCKVESATLTGSSKRPRFATPKSSFGFVRSAE